MRDRKVFQKWHELRKTIHFNLKVFCGIVGLHFAELVTRKKITMLSLA